MIHYPMLQKHVSTLETLKLPQHKHKYADRVSRTGAPKYFFIVARSSFQSQMRLKWSHRRALYMVVIAAIPKKKKKNTKTQKVLCANDTVSMR